MAPQRLDPGTVLRQARSTPPSVNDSSSVLTFHIAINTLYPGIKLPSGDKRWGGYTRNFKPKRHTLTSFTDDIRPGYSFSPVMDRNHRSQANFISAQHMVLDFYPGGVLMNFGIFVEGALMGVAVLSAGSANLHRLFSEAKNLEVACLARLWLDDRLGRNAESRILGVIFRQLRRYQSTIKSLVAYSDPEAGHTGTIYRGAGMLYIGMSTAMALYRLPDGTVQHSRSLGHSYGSHSLKHFESHGLKVELVEQVPKHT